MNNSESENTLFRDVLFQIVTIFISITALILLLITIQKKVEEEKVENALGTLNIEIAWDNDLDVDVDLWVLTPVSRIPIGFKNKSNSFVNLVRDDLGKTNDSFLDLNYENVLSRGIAEGEYIVNVHMYSQQYKIVRPITVKVAVTYFSPYTSYRNVLLERTVTLNKHWEQITVFRFKLKKDGTLVSGSLSYYPADLLQPSVN